MKIAAITFFVLVLALLALGKLGGWHIKQVATVESKRDELMRASLSPNNILLLESIDGYLLIDLNKEFDKFNRMPFEKVYRQAPRWSDFTEGKPPLEITKGFEPIPLVKDMGLFWPLKSGQSPLQQANPTVLLLYREFTEERSWMHFHLFSRNHVFPTDPPVKRNTAYPAEPRHEFFIEQPIHRSYTIEGRRFIDG
jgi:hypothetical protein